MKTLDLEGLESLASVILTKVAVTHVHFLTLCPKIIAAQTAVRRFICMRRMAKLLKAKAEEIAIVEQFFTFVEEAYDSASVVATRGEVCGSVHE